MKLLASIYPSKKLVAQCIGTSPIVSHFKLVLQNLCSLMVPAREHSVLESLLRNILNGQSTAQEAILRGPNYFLLFRAVKED